MIDKKNWFWEVVFSNKKIYYQIFLASFFINVFAICSAFYVMTVYDKVIPNSAISSLVGLAIGMVLIHIFDFIIKLLRSYFIDIAGQKLDDTIAERLYSKISQHSNKAIGETNSQTVSTIREFDTFRDFFTSSSMVLFIDIPFMFIFVIILWFIGGMVALVPTLIIPIVIIVAALIQPNLRSMAEGELKSKQSKLGILVELLNGHEAVRTIVGDSFLKDKWLNAVKTQNEVGIVQKVFANFSTTFAQTAVASSQTFIVFFGVFLIISTDLTTGALVACVILSGRTLAPLVQLGGIMTRVNAALASFRKIDALMNIVAKDETFSDDSVISLTSGSIEIKNFNFSENDTPILRNINLKIDHGEKVGIVGDVGSGKSTLIKSIVGYHPVEQGKIIINSFDINNIESKELRNAISYIPQSIHLFTGRIQDNIVAGLENYSNEDIINASKNANAHEFISSLPGGYSAQISENGGNLSGGQKQKIIIARALMRDAIINVFDEPSNSLDGTTEEIFKNYIKNNYQDKTVIIATHKPSLLSLVDRILVVANGTVVADGPKEKIINNSQNVEQKS
tara:strand:- start:1205 stop:2902 length:1698 start_codon:yes stop_codon:yes gene_type:complete